MMRVAPSAMRVSSLLSNWGAETASIRPVTAIMAAFSSFLTIISIASPS